MNASQQTYIKGLRYGWLTRFYDPVIKLFFDEDRLREQFISQMNLTGNETALDLGCGTGTLSIMLKMKYPGLKVVGIDGDNDMLLRARNKAALNNTKITFTHALAQSLPFEPDTFDVVVSSLVFHHLPTDVKKSALEEIHRILIPGGKLYISDWGQPSTRIERMRFYSIQMLDGFKTTADNVSGKLFQYINDAFDNTEEIIRINTLFGVMSVYTALKDSAQNNAL